jgi:c-di-GMP-binding flagellar brake protein YcgR
MNYGVEFLINGKIEIEMEDGIYKSNIQDVGENTLGISIPVNNGKYLPLHKGEKIKCIYLYKNKTYMFNTVVISRKVDRILIIEIKKPDKLNIYQRRNFVRVSFVEDVLCTLVPQTKDARHLDSQIHFFNAMSLDISGGGMKLSIDPKDEDGLRYGDIIMVSIPVNNGNIAVKGKIVRIDNNVQTHRIICGVSFVDLHESSRDKIILLVFKIMREQIKKKAKEE